MNALRLNRESHDNRAGRHLQRPPYLVLNARNRTENHGYMVGVILASGDFSVQDWAVRYAIICVREVPLWFYLVADALQTTY